MRVCPNLRKKFTKLFIFGAIFRFVIWFWWRFEKNLDSSFRQFYDFVRNFSDKWLC